MYTGTNNFEIFAKMITVQNCTWIGLSEEPLIAKGSGLKILKIVKVKLMLKRSSRY